MHGLSQLRKDRIPIRPLGHHKQTLTYTLGFPNIPHIAFFLGVIITPAVAALIFHNQKTTISEFTNKIRVKAIG